MHRYARAWPIRWITGVARDQGGATGVVLGGAGPLTQGPVNPERRTSSAPDVDGVGAAARHCCDGERGGGADRLPKQEPHRSGLAVRFYPSDLIGSIYELLGIDPDGPLPNPLGQALTVTPTAADGIPMAGRLKEIM